MAAALHGRPPNAAIVLDHAATRHDALAFELRLRSHHGRTARFDARVLPGVGGHLATLHHRLDRSLPERLGPLSLFVDNFLPTLNDCSLGQPELFTAPWTVNGYLSAPVPPNQYLLPLSSNSALFSLWGTTYGGDGQSDFGVPALSPPLAGLSWQLCVAEQFYPTSSQLGPCTTGDVDLFTLPSTTAAGVTDPAWIPADGSTVSRADQPALAAVVPGSGPITLPKPEPPVPGSFWLVCANGVAPSSEGAQNLGGYIGELDLVVAGVTAADRLSADGQVLPINPYQTLFSQMGDEFGGNAQQGTFALPDPPAVTGAQWQIYSAGVWPWQAGLPGPQ
jgi:microcystin-dependent protein